MNTHVQPLRETEARMLIEAELPDRDLEEDGYIMEHMDRYIETINFMVPVASGSKVLDIGIYDGALDVLIKNHFSVHVSGIDVRTPDNVRWIERFKRLGIEFNFCDLLKEIIPYADAEFDLVTMCEVVEHLPSMPNEIFKEARRVLREGGTFILTSSNIASLYRRLRLLFGNSPIVFFRDYTLEELVQTLERVGFEISSVTYRDYRRKTQIRRAGRRSAYSMSIVEALYGLIVHLYPRFRNSIMIKALAKH